MSDWIGTVVVVGVILFFVWLMTPNRKSKAGELIDPNDSLQIGMLAGIAGRSIPDAAVMRFALKRFEESYGRPATTRDIGIVLGIVDSMPPGQ